ncbi:quinate permease [Pyricularia oryzae]|nr:quinate permease [Pyricularia oryzae]KAI7915539.1 quinate permease [Pyricularia oryzae]
MRNLCVGGLQGFYFFLVTPHRPVENKESERATNASIFSLTASCKGKRVKVPTHPLVWSPESRVHLQRNNGPRSGLPFYIKDATQPHLVVFWLSFISSLGFLIISFLAVQTFAHLDASQSFYTHPLLPKAWPQKVVLSIKQKKDRQTHHKKVKTNPREGGIIMTLLALKEDRPTPKAVYNWRVYLCASIASFASCTIGYDSAFIGTTLALPSFTDEFQFASYSASDLALLKANIVSLYQAGAFFGSLFAYVSSYFLGRKKSLMMFSLIFMVGASLMLGATRERGLGLILGGRVLAGLGIGGMSNMTPIYISELSPPAVRGRLVGIYELGWQIGGLVGFWINYGVNSTLPPSHSQWLIPFAVQLIPGGMLLLGAIYIPESPRWLFEKGQREKAIKVLSWMRNLEPDHQYIVEEISYIDEGLEQQRREIGAGFWKPFAALKARRVQWRFILGGLLFMWQNGSGINAINYYSPTVFQSLGITGTNTGFLTTGLFGVVKTVLTVIWLMWMIDHWGRRPLLIMGGIGGGACMWFIGAYIKIAQPEKNPNSGGLPPGGIAAIFFFYLWTAFYTPSWNGTPWVINSEMFDQNTRSLGQANAAANNWFWNFIISRFTPTMFEEWGYGVYFFFASLMFVSVVFIFFLVPETKSIPLEKMDRLFEIRPVHRANATVMSELGHHSDGSAPVLGGEPEKGEAGIVEDGQVTPPPTYARKDGVA